ncbi:hypothetical protein AB0K09_13195 [Streptomyces sp. NPDC049577]|uniref:hypothetical protein n=1 Tax=Streptomyces sp. NPDC049577 TaxID=3155153 RepID=UPI003424EC78
MRKKWRLLIRTAASALAATVLLCACTLPTAGHGADRAAPGAGHEPPRPGPPLGRTVVLGLGLMATGAGMGLVVLYRSRREG